MNPFHMTVRRLNDDIEYEGRMNRYCFLKGGPEDELGPPARVIGFRKKLGFLQAKHLASGHWVNVSYGSKVYFN